MASVQERVMSGGRLSWRVLYRLDGRQRSLTFGDGAQATHWKSVFETVGVEDTLRLYAESLQPEPDDDAVPTVRDIVEDYIDHHTGLSSGTRGRHRKEAARDIYPMLGDVPITQVNSRTGEKWVAHLASHDRALASGKKLEPLSPKTISNRHGLLSSSFNRVVPRLLPANPLRGLRLPEGRQVDMVFLTSQEWWLLHDCIGAFWQPFTTALVATGMRFGEATALQVGDVDLVARRIRVTKAWKEDENGHRYIGPPKSSAGTRSIGFDAHLHKILTQVCQGRGTASLLFVNRAGQPILNGSFHSRIWSPAIAKAQSAGLTKRPRPHDLRHTFASWALADGAVNIWKLATIMGHDVEMTQKRYGHLMEGSLADVARVGLNRSQA